MKTFSELIQSPRPVLVDFFATWCGPCKMMQPVLHDLKAALGDSLTIVKVDIDKQRAPAQQFSIQGVPTLILFQNGKVLWRQSGVMSAAQLQSVIRPYLGSASAA